MGVIIRESGKSKLIVSEFGRNQAIGRVQLLSGISIYSVIPAYGSVSGGTAVTITGSGFVDITYLDVYFGASNPPSESFTLVNSTTITCDTPAGSGSVTVSVADKSLANAFDYYGVVLTSSGFGAKSPAAPLYFSTFADATLGAAADHASVGLEIRHGGGSDSLPRIVNDKSHSGGQCLRCDYGPGDSSPPPNGWFRAVGIWPFPADRLDIYVAQWSYNEATGSGTIANFKCNRGGSGDTYSGTPQYNATLGSVADWSGNNQTNWNDGVNNHELAEPDPLSPTEDQWDFTEWQYRLSTPGVADGWFRWFCNGTENNGANPAATRAEGVTGKAGWAFCSINGADQMSGDLEVAHYVDELLINCTHARVIATDNATYGSSTKWAPQAPTVWSDTDIGIATPNWGDLSGTAYFHVFDADNNHIEAFARSVP